jgi:hypothetical protein
MRRFPLRAAGFAAVAATLAFGTPKARADIIIDYSLDGGLTFNPLVDGPSGTAQVLASGTLGAFSISVLSVSSNSPGTTNLAKLLSDSLDLINTSGSTASIVFAFSDTGFNSPTTPPSLLLNSHIGGSIAVGSGANLASFTSCVSTTNTNLTSCTGATDVAGPGTPGITTGSFSNDQFATIASLVAPYSITSIWNVTLGAGSDVGFQANATLAPIPEPLSLSLLATGLIGLGVIRRRRRG